MLLTKDSEGKKTTQADKIHYYFCFEANNHRIWSSDLFRNIFEVLVNQSYLAINPGADPGFFLEGGAPLMNDVTDSWCKQMLQNSS